MKGLRILGDYALEFLVITVLVALSAASVIFFVPMIVGVTGYFSRGMDARRFKDIFTTIGRNWKILIIYTIFQLVIVVVPILNIYFFNTHPANVNYFVLAVSVVALIVGIVYLATAPTVIVNMEVKFPQLLYNGVMMLFGSLWRSLIAVLLIAGVVALILFYPYLVAVTLYFAPMLISRMMTENFYRLKAKALKTSVFELRKKENADDYLDEKGAVKRDEMEKENEKD